MREPKADVGNLAVGGLAGKVEETEIGVDEVVVDAVEATVVDLGGSVAVVGAGVDEVARERSGSSEDMTDVPIWVMRSRRDEGEKRECLFEALSSEELGLLLLDDDPDDGASDSVMSLGVNDSVAVDTLEDLAEPDGSRFDDLDSEEFESALLDEPAAEYGVEDGDAGLAGSDIIWIRRSSGRRRETNANDRWTCLGGQRPSECRYW